MEKINNRIFGFCLVHENQKWKTRGQKTKKYYLYFPKQILIEIWKGKKEQVKKKKKKEEKKLFLFLGTIISSQKKNLPRT